MIYTFAMMPRLGPSLDIDLFFNAFLVSALLAGLALDSLTAQNRSLRTWIVVAVLANTAAVARYLVFGQLPNP